MSTYEASRELSFFESTIDSLARYFFHLDTDEEFDPEISPKELKKSAWVASILASSPDEEHQKLALSFGVMAFTYVSESNYREGAFEEIYEEYLYIILSRIGNLPGTSVLGEDDDRVGFVEDQISGFDSILSLELENEAASHRIAEEEYLTSFQKKAWLALNEGKNLAISGPTSSGKSHILQKFIQEQIDSNDTFQGLYVVPTRALISEVSTDLSESVSGISIRNGAYFRGLEEDENIFLVVTPERCLKLVEEDTRSHIDPDLIFFDEFQSLEKDSRGVLFENIIEGLEEYWPDSQIVAAGPYLENPKEKLVEFTGREVEEITTVLSPVFQLGVTLRFISQRKQKDRRMEIVVHSPSGNTIEFETDEPDEITYTDIKNNSIPKVVNEYGGDGKEIIYAHRRDKAEDWARSISGSESFLAEEDLSEETRQLINYLSKNIHEDYSLVNCLKRGVAFHHGRVPEIARNEIEDIYEDEDSNVDTLVSTPTLLQGVNLPSKRMFVIDPRKGTEDLTKFEFANLIGRVGRLQKRLYGTVYFIETNKDEWSSEKYDTEMRKEITPATDQAVKKKTSELLRNLDNTNLYEIEDGSIRYTTTILRNKFLKSEHSVEDYLQEKGMNDVQRYQAHSKLSRFLSNTEVPLEMLNRNPMVDPYRQHILFNQVQDNPDWWVIKRSRGVYEQFERITKRLNQIFKFANDSDVDFYLNREQAEVNYPLGHVITTGHYWLQGQSYRHMIEKRYNHPSIDADTINDAIEEGMEIINTGVRHVLVKYFKLLIDALEIVQDEPDEWMQSFDRMLELGSMEFNDLYLIGQGVDRSITQELDIPEDEEDPTEYLRSGQLELSAFNKRHLDNLNIL